MFLFAAFGPSPSLSLSLSLPLSLSLSVSPSLCFLSRSQLPVAKAKAFEYMCSKTIVFTMMNSPMFNKTLFFTMNTAGNDIKIWSNENTAFLKRKNCGRANRNKTPTTRSPIRVAKNHFPTIGRSLTTIYCCSPVFHKVWCLQVIGRDSWVREATGGSVQSHPPKNWGKNTFVCKRFSRKTESPRNT